MNNATASRVDIRSRIEGGILGLLVGDALGVPYEFKSAGELPSFDAIEMTPPEGFRRSHSGVKVGTWSDDGAQALALLASLLECGRLDVDDLGRRLLDWYDHGYMTPDGCTFDIGMQTRQALEILRGGAPANESGPNGVADNGNGSLMRVLPLALWHTGGDEELVEDAMRQSLVTHGHLRARLACALYCLWARFTMQGEEDAWDRAVKRLRELRGRDDDDEHEEIRLIIGRSRDHEPGGTGYVVDSLHSACWAVEQGPYETVVKRAIALGVDTDTTACVAGGIAGVRDGVEAIPPRWRDALRGMHLVQPLIDALVERRESA